MSAVLDGAREAEWRAFEAYFTPTAVVQQVLQSLATITGWATRKAADIELQELQKILTRRTGRTTEGWPRIADLGAGAGVWSMVSRAVWPRAEVLGLEVRGSELAHLSRHCHHVMLGAIQQLGRRIVAWRPDLVVSNPPFSLTGDFLELALEAAPIVVFLVRATWGDSEEANDLLERYPPAIDLVITSRPHMLPRLACDGEHRGGDNVGHQVLVWSRARRSLVAQRLRLPRLPSSLIRWVERPGTELEPPPLLGPEHVLDLAHWGVSLG